MRVPGLYLLLGLSLLPACTHRAAPPPSTLRIQLATEPASLDPALAEDGASIRILYNTMEGLVGYDGGGKLRNRLAESYSVSPDGRRYTFVLRKQARWSDGKPVTAGDFVTGIRRALTPQSGSKLAGIFFVVKGAKANFEGKAKASELGVRAEGDRLVIDLEQAAPYFVQALTLPVAMPERQDVLDAHGGRWPESAPVTGPYRISSHEPDRRFVFEKNPGYWQSTSEYPAVEMLIVADESTGMNLFEQGGIDVLTKIGSGELQALRKKPGVLHTDPFLATYYLSFNHRKAPFNDRRWRQAVSGAVRRDEIVKALDSGETPARSWVPRGLEGYIPYTDPMPEFAPAFDAVRAQGAPTETLAAAYDTSARNTMVMEKVQHDLKAALGLKISLGNLDWKTYLKTVQTDPPPLFRLGILSPFMDPIQILESFTTGDPNNYLKWSDPDYDRLVREIAALAPGPARERKIREAEEVLVDREAIVVPIYHYVQNHVVAARVQGFKVNPFGVIRFDELRIR
jgi:oligopeptide transport system substrate-binding protein